MAKVQASIKRNFNVESSRQLKPEAFGVASKRPAKSKLAAEVGSGDVVGGHGGNARWRVAPLGLVKWWSADTQFSGERFRLLLPP